MKKKLIAGLLISVVLLSAPAAFAWCGPCPGPWYPGGCWRSNNWEGVAVAGILALGAIITSNNISHQQRPVVYAPPVPVPVVREREVRYKYIPYGSGYAYVPVANAVAIEPTPAPKPIPTTYETPRVEPIPTTVPQQQTIQNLNWRGFNETKKSDDNVGKLGLTFDETYKVKAVKSGSAAYDVDLRVGDEIIGIDKYHARDYKPERIKSYIEKRRYSGYNVSISIRRNGKKIVKTIPAMFQM